MKIEPINRSSLSEAVFEQLCDRILAGELAAGDALPAERALAEMLGVNRGALREAIKRLEQAGFVSVQQGGATRINDFQRTAGLDVLPKLLVRGGTLDPGVARAIIEFRSALAPDVARLAALRCTPPESERITAAAEVMADASLSTEELQHAAMSFWIAVVDGAHNVAYRLAYNALRDTYSRCFHLLTTVLTSELRDARAYRAIAKAIAKRDTSTAERRTRALVQEGEEKISEILETLESMES